MYIDGVKVNTQQASGLTNPTDAVSGTATYIGDYNSIILGRSHWENNDGYFCGWIRNLQIVASADVRKLKLGSSVPNGTIRANSVAMTTTGSYYVPGSNIELTATPNSGYYADWSAITLDKNVTPNTSHVFVMPTGLAANEEVTISAADAFKQVQYTLTYDLNGGSDTAPTDDGTFTYNGGNRTIPATKFTRSGYEFVGWSTTTDGSGTIFAPGASATPAQLGVGAHEVTTTAKAVTLYAIWAESKVKSYLISKENFLSQKASEIITITGGDEAVFWDDEMDAAYFVGGELNNSGAITSGKKSQITINDGPFANVNVTTGFTVAMDVWIDKTCTKWGRLIDVNDRPKNTYNCPNYFFINGGCGTGDTSSDRSKYYGHLETCFNYTNSNTQAEKVSIMNNTSKTYYDQWITLFLTVKPDGKSTLYINNEEYSNSPTTSDAVTAIKNLLTNIKDFETVSLDKSNLNNDGYFKGWMRNVQIFSSGNLAKITSNRDASTQKQGYLTATIDGAEKQVSSSGIMASEGVTLTLKPSEGFKLTSLTKGGGSNLVGANGQYEYVVTSEAANFNVQLTEKSYTAAYDAAEGTLAGGETTSKNYWADYTTGNAPTREGYTFEGWKTSDGTLLKAATKYVGGSALNKALNNAADGSGKIQFTAVWKPILYKVAADAGINGGTVSLSRSSGKLNDGVDVRVEADEGYTLQTLTWKENGSATEHDIKTNPHFTLGASDVTVYATFTGDRDLRLSGSAPANGNLEVGGTTLTTDNKASIGRKVRVVALPQSSYKLKTVTYQKVADASVMKARTRSGIADDNDVPIGQEVTLTYGTDQELSFDQPTGRYVATISDVAADLLVNATFEQKIDLATVSDVKIEGIGRQTYTGSAIEPTGYTVKVNGEVMDPDTYTLTFTDNVNTGTATATITAKDNNPTYYNKKENVTAFTIITQGPSGYTIDEIATYTYTGSVIEPSGSDVVVRDDNGNAVSNSRYTLAYDCNTNAGTATVVATFNSDAGVSGSLVQTFTILPKPITVTASAQTVTYGDELAQTDYSVTDGSLVSGHTLAAATLTAAEVNAGTYSGGVVVSNVKITSGTDPVTDETANYDITYAPGNLTINKAPLTLKAADRTVTFGTTKEELTTGSGNSYTLSGFKYEDTSSSVSITTAPTYTTTYGLDSDPSQAYTITPTGAVFADGNYEPAYAPGKVTVTAFDLSSAVITVTDNVKNYDGTAKTATVTVKTAEDGTVIGPQNYYVYYGTGTAESQTECGTYAITVKARGNNLTGVRDAGEMLTISKVDMASATATIADQTYTGQRLMPEFATLKVGDQNISTDDYQVTAYGDNTNVGTEAGSVTITAKPGRNFTGTKEVKFNIVAADLATATVTYGDDLHAADNRLLTPDGTSKVTALYTGSPLRLTDASLAVKVSGGTEALPATDYTVKYKQGDATTDKIDGIGTYTVVIEYEGANTKNSLTTGLTVEVKNAISLRNNTWSSFYSSVTPAEGKSLDDYAMALPTGYDAAYIVTAFTGTSVTMSSALTYLPAGVPVVLHMSGSTDTGELTDFEAAKFTGTVSTPATLASTGTVGFLGYDEDKSQTALQGTTQYVLLGSQFVKLEAGSVLEKNRCYLYTGSAAASSRLTLDFSATAVEAIANGQSTTDNWYDMQGRRLNGKPQRKGLYIRNGQKVSVK